MLGGRSLSTSEKMCPVWRLLFLWVHLSLCSSLTTEKEHIHLSERTATKEEGSCVTIHCDYLYEEGLELIWFKNAEWIQDLKHFNGTIVYSNTQKYPQASEYSNRVEFLNYTTDSNRYNCTITINSLKISDSGNYRFRYIKGDIKQMSTMNMSLTVNASACQVHLKPLNKTLREKDTVTLQCSTSEQCKNYPKWKTSLNYTTEDVGKEKVSKLLLNVTWKDHGTTLSCHPAEGKDDCQTRNITLTVEFAPKETKITGNPENVNKGDKVTLTCSTIAHPKVMSYMWFKDNKEQLNQHTETYILNKVKAEDSGEYHCQATNDHGKQNSSTVKINVQYAPEGVEVRVENKYVTKGRNLTLTCFVQRVNPAVDFHRWYKDNNDMKQNRKEIVLQNVTKHNNGRYLCEASNGIGKTSSNQTEISVKYAPENITIQGNKEIKLGLNLILCCSSDAYPQPSLYSWYYKSESTQHYVALPQTNKEYQVAKVAINNSGWYMCSPKNDIGSGLNSTEFEVLILYPPRQLTLNMPSVLRETEKFTITCSAESYPVAEITLSRTSLTNTKPKTVNMEKVGLSTLTLSYNVSESHAGEYTCTAENSEGKNYTKQQLKVLYTPKDVKASVDSSGGLKEGTDLTLTCKAHSEPSVSKYEWKKSMGAQTVKVGDGQNLTLHSLNASHSGNYSCTARNSLGEKTSASEEIRVKYRPYIKVIQSSRDGTTSVQLFCNAECYPAATQYKWYRNNETEALSDHQSYTVHPQQAGIYYCNVTNEIGESTSERVELFLNSFLQKLLKIVMPLCLLCILTVLLILMYRIFLRKRSSDGADRQSFFFSLIPDRSSTVSDLFLLGSRNNTRENLATEGAMWTNSQTNSSSTNSDIHRTGSVSNIHTVYDALMLPRARQETDSPIATYSNLQSKTNHYPTTIGCDANAVGPVYAAVSKNKQKTKVVQNANEDYENVSGAQNSKPDFSNIDWESDTSEEEEEEVHYTQVTITVNPQNKPKRTEEDSSSEEEKTVYTQVKT
ncbi:B-cell receptor CD22 isoform X2 [Hoplias malabaricus]|uniref:B-cell receptor CD22 isoform X2 n=1 Tax=Hoplias malabaricus TaxID=27720 RepID=UPI003461B0D8